jgi:hypothetical protein
MAAPLAEEASLRNPDAALDKTRTNREHISSTGRNYMFAMISSLVFVAAAWIAGTVVHSTIQSSRSRIAGALYGRPLPRISPELRAAA